MSDMSKRIDLYVSEKYGLTRAAVQKMIANDQVTVNGAIKTEKNYKVKPGDIIEIEFCEPKEINIPAQDLNLDVLYEDGDLIVINKRQGMVVHPSQDNYRDTLVNALLHHCKGSLSGINGEIRPGIVHRLDRDTSGVMIAAKSNRAHLGLAEQIKAHSFTRIYNAVAFGNFKNNQDDCGTINLPLGRSKKDFRKIAVYKTADPENKIREAITHFEVLGRHSYKNNSYTHLKLRLETGRTHQIRVHLSHLGHPVIGDSVYGNAGINKNFAFLNGQCLHSKSIEFVHPVTGENIFIESDLPEYFMKVTGLLNNG
jgi:23S rRNA pseudouridine1911/1915/1917 synthase